MSIVITEKAAKHIQDSIAKRGTGVGLRVGVKPSGCSGMSYTVDFADVVDEADEVFEQQGVKLVVDRKSLPFLQGTEIDFVRDGLNRRFEFRNPNVTGTCGCGESVAF